MKELFFNIVFCIGCWTLAGWLIHGSEWLKDFMFTPRIYPPPMPPIPKKKKPVAGGYQPDGRNALNLSDPPGGH